MSPQKKCTAPPPPRTKSLNPESVHHPPSNSNRPRPTPPVPPQGVFQLSLFMVAFCMSLVLSTRVYRCYERWRDARAAVGGLVRGGRVRSGQVGLVCGCVGVPLLRALEGCAGSHGGPGGGLRGLRAGRPGGGVGWEERSGGLVPHRAVRACRAGGTRVGCTMQPVIGGTRYQAVHGARRYSAGLWRVSVTKDWACPCCGQTYY